MSIFSPIQPNFRSNYYDTSVKTFECFENAILQTPFQGYSELTDSSDFTNLRVHKLLFVL